MLFIALLLSTASAQSTVGASATGSLSWNSPGTWTAGGVPGITTTSISILGGAQVYLNSTLPAFSAALTLGTAGTANTALVIQGTALGLIGLTWANGQIQMSGGASVTVANPVNPINFAAAGGASIDRQIVGGTFTLGPLSAGASVNGQVSCTGCTLDSSDKVWTLNSGAVVFANASALASGVVFSGTGSVSVSAGGSVAIAASKSLVINAGVSAQVDGSIDLKDNSVVDAFGTVVIGASGAISGTAQSNFHANASCTLNGGAYVRGGLITVDGALGFNTAAGTTAVVVSGQGTTTIAGTGSVAVNGRFDAMTAITATVNDFQVKAKGDFRIAGGVVASFKNISFDADSDWYLSFPSSGSFAAVTVTGSVNLGGRFHLQLPDPLPVGTVRLVTAGSISGSFNGAAMLSTSGAAGRRLLDQGSVSVSQNSIDYTRSGAASIGFFGLVVASVLALF